MGIDKGFNAALLWGGGKPELLREVVRRLKRWDEGRWVKGSLVYTLLYWGLFPIPHLPSSHLLSPLKLEKVLERLSGDAVGDLEI